MFDPCPICEGSGLQVTTRPDGSRVAADCVCRVSRRGARQFEAARIPERYRDCTLDNFVVNLNGANRSLNEALLLARGFIDSHSWTTDGNGLLFTGSIGVGKTHLATGILQALITTRGVRGLFVDYRDLLKRVQDSYSRSVESTERQVLRPILEAEVLVLDELGAARRTDWVWDTVEHILNTRYNDCRTTIITTNYDNAPSAGAGFGTSQSAARTETLGDRIGDRMRSRLQEMCRVVDMRGDDYRQIVKRASFAYERVKRPRRLVPE